MIKRIIKFNFEMVTEKPKKVLISIGLITIIAILLASQLELNLSWVGLAPQNHPAVEEYQEIIEQFPTLNNIIVVLESDDIQALEKTALHIQEEMRLIPEYVKSTSIGVPQEFINKYGLLYTSEEEIGLLAYLQTNPNLVHYLQTMNITLEKMEKTDLDDKQYQTMQKTFLQQLDQLYSQINNSLNEEYNSASFKNTVNKMLTGSTLFTSENGKMAMIMIQPTFDIMDLENIIVGTNTIESRIYDLQNDNVKIGVTGMHIVVRDEASSIESDSLLTTAISIGLILFLLYFAFRSYLAPVLTFVPLVVGVIWSIGLAKLTIGRLNMMTAFSAAMLLGLGIDFAIHFYSSYTERRSKGISKKDAINNAMNISGPGIITGGLTTGLAFLTLNISSLAILRELGTIMGLGIFMTLISLFWVLPSFIMLKKEKEDKVKKITGEYKFLGFIAKGVVRFKWIVIPCILILTIYMGYNAKDVQFDTNLMNLEPEGLKSIELMNYLVEEYEVSTDSFSVTVDTLEETYSLQEAFEKIDGVKEVTSIATILPKKTIQEEKVDIIKEYKLMFSYPTEYKKIEQEELITLVENYKKTLINISDNANEFQAYIDNCNQLLNKLDHTNSLTELNILTKDFYDYFQELGNQMFSGEMLLEENLPEDYKSQFISENPKKYMITIYPDFNVWENLNTEKGEAFFEAIYNVKPQITGTPIFMKALYDSVSEELSITGLVLFVMLIVVLIVHFKKILYALFAFIPLLLTLIFTVGTMVIFNMKLNMLNFLSVLLIIGIGIDDGVHILHHYKSGNRNIYSLFSHVGRAILLTTLTTLCGFGSLMFSSYRGISTLGSALFIGVGYAFIMTIVVLPIILNWVNKLTPNNDK